MLIRARAHAERLRQLQGRDARRHDDARRVRDRPPLEQAHGAEAGQGRALAQPARTAARAVPGAVTVQHHVVHGHDRAHREQRGRVGLGGKVHGRGTAQRQPGSELGVLVELRREPATACQRARDEDQARRRQALRQLRAALDQHADAAGRRLGVERRRERADVGADAASAVLLEAALQAARVEPDRP